MRRAWFSFSTITRFRHSRFRVPTTCSQRQVLQQQVTAGAQKVTQDVQEDGQQWTVTGRTESDQGAPTGSRSGTMDQFRDDLASWTMHKLNMRCRLHPVSSIMQFCSILDDNAGREVVHRLSCNGAAYWTKRLAMYIRRTLDQHFREAADHFPVMLVTGARQVGKTTFLREIAGEGRTYLSLDDPRVVELARSDPAQFMQRYPGPVIIDEIQYAPGLLPYIKLAVDGEGRPGRFWLTGSQQFHLMRDVAESLAGRVGIMHLLGLSR